MITPPTWYHATAPAAPDRPALSGIRRTRVCVIGGGLTGVSAALHLAERGIDCVLLEAERIGHGASGRNGGQIVQGYSCGMDTIERAVGRDDAAVLWSMAREAVDDIKDRVARHGIDCDLRWGYLHAAFSKRQMAGLREMAAHEAAYGSDRCRVVDKSELQGVVGTELYAGGLLDPESGQIHPLAYLRGLAEAAERAGAVLLETSPARKIDRGIETQSNHGPRVVVHTDHGAVEADWLVLAGNAYLGAVERAIRPRLMPVASFVAVTEQLDRDLIRALFPQDVAVADCNMALDYYRLTSDGRLLFGSGASYSARTPPSLETWMAKRIRRVSPELAETRLDHVWSGLIGITANRAPDFGRIGDSVLYAQGFSGQGMALTGLAGKLMAETIETGGKATGDAHDRFSKIEQIRHLPFPGGPLRTPTLMAAMAFAKLRDSLGL